MYYVYMLRCEDNSIYTGIAKDIEKRMNEYFSKDEKCAKYTKSHQAKKLEASWQTEDKKLASKLEYAIKTLRKEQKERLIQKQIGIEDIFYERLECEKYKRVPTKNRI